MKVGRDYAWWVSYSWTYEWFDEDVCEDDVYIRSKELFSNLDKIWKIYDQTEFDLTDDNCMEWMVLYLHKFLNTTETRLYLEGKIQYIHGIHI